ncbi:MAG: DEAD/DEAH box helicase [Methylococcaceae bacterium]|nr:DEAD/DEAH box helicase [Methylococcaceae bacterium]
MNEAETRAELIDPALRASGWGVVEASRIRREVISQGRLIGGGKRSKTDIADYVLVYKGQKLAVIEAKKISLSITEGLAQAKRYAERLQTRFAYSTNGKGIYQVDMKTGEEGNIKNYPSPDELWQQVFTAQTDIQNKWREQFATIPFEDKSGSWQARYYQHNAINKALEAIGTGQQPILLTLATGTGKTCIAFQLAWKLFHSRWTLKSHDKQTEFKRRPRILFLADRNILANQAFNDFSAFAEDALLRISPDEIRKKGQVPKNGSIFFTIFQTFMSGKDEDERPAPYFGAYASDFFDFIIIDECHRGGAKDESEWRGILEYFSPAVQLGLTATPKRKINADTYDYFGEPVYIYSLKEGINEGYLTPFRVQQIGTTIDEYSYSHDDSVLEGEVDETKIYSEKDFNRKINIEAREAYRVKTFMDGINQNEKTLVFCATQAHAAQVRDLINQYKHGSNPNYCVRVTANDGKEGERWLETFQDNEKTIPTILTSSQKLSTGVDARNIRNIVLMRPVTSMIEFKQIIGRGTRLFEGKDYFTIYDFVKASELFRDDDWDGEPLEADACKRCAQTPCVCVKEPQACYECQLIPCECEAEACAECGELPCICEKPAMLKLKLADGKARNIRHLSAVSFWSPDGQPISATQFIENLYGELPALFDNEDKLIELWKSPDTRKALLAALEEKGFGLEPLIAVKQLINAENSDLFDVLAYIAFTSAPISRAERVSHHKTRILESYTSAQQQFIDFVLEHYITDGVSELEQDKLPDLLELKYQSVSDAVNQLGKVTEIRDIFVGFQAQLYARAESTEY